MKSGDGDGHAPPAAEERRLFHEAVTDQFASLMETWTKGAVRKILAMLKGSVCEAEAGPAAEPRSGPEGASAEPRAGRLAGPKSQCAARISRQKRKKMEGGATPAPNDHIYYREEQTPEEPAAAGAEYSGPVTTPADAATPESTSGSPSVPDAVSTEAASDVSEEDGVQEDAGASTAASRLKKKQKTTAPLQCPSCDKTFALKCMLDRHHLTHTKPHLCAECGKSFSEKQGLAAHSRRHAGEKPYECSDCGVAFAYKYTLARHVRRHGLKTPSARTCALCDGQFGGALELQRHRCGALATTFSCSLCPEAFSCRTSLAEHENLHPGARGFVCEVCGESFFSSASLTAHRVTHGPPDDCRDAPGLGSSGAAVLRGRTGHKLFSCDVCGKGCSHRSALKHHMLTHTGDKPYVCDTCGKRCGHASALQNHMRVHTGRKRGQRPACAVCGKKFRCAANLKYHTSVHTGVKPYGCDRCDKKFSNPSNLRIHAAIHSGVKRYGCNVCGRRFTQAVGLKLHRRVHTGEKPYFCAACGKRFMHGSDFRKHQRGHMGEEPENTTVEN